MIQEKPSPVLARLSSSQTEQAGAWALICGALRAHVLKGPDHPQAFKGFFWVKLMSMYNKLKLCCLADFFPCICYSFIS